MYSGNNPFIAALVSDGWLDVGKDNIVSYTFKSDYGMDFTDAEISAFETAMSMYEAVCNVKFVEETSDPAKADIAENLVTTAELAEILGTEGFGGWHVEPLANGQSNGYYTYDHSDWISNLVPGKDSFWLVTHELGHALGLEHPHSTWHGSGLFPGITENVGSDTGDNGLNSGYYTVMGYNYQDGTGAPMAFDIAALQYLYGANTTFASEGDTYVLPGSKSGSYWSCLWDTGGIDTIVCNSSAGATIDLRAATLENAPGGGGYLSSVSGITGGFTIANGVVIENARGGTGADKLVGNGVSNVLNGASGNDKIYGYGDDDYLYGFAGNDFLYGGVGNDYLSGGGGKDMFCFNTALSGDIDVIADFSVKDDTIQLDNAIFTKLGGTGTLSSSMFRKATVAYDSNDYVIYNPKTGALLYDSNGKAAGGIEQIATLQKNLALTAADFSIV